MVTAITVVIALLPCTREVVKAYPLLKAGARSRRPSARSVADSIFSARRGFSPEATGAQKLLSFKKHLVAPLSASPRLGVWGDQCIVTPEVVTFK